MYKKGGHTGSRRGAVIGFDHMSGPHSEGEWTGISCPVVHQGVESLMDKVTTSAECMNVTCYSLFREGTANAAGKELHEVLVNL